MRWKRRGIRRGTFLTPRENNSFSAGDHKKTPPVGWEEFYEKIAPLIRPDWKGKTENLSGMYREIGEEDQKKLTHKIAGQILFAHSDVVKKLFERLSAISLDLAQQTEVAYRRICLIDKFF